MEERFYMTEAHIRALEHLVFIHCAAEPEQNLAACLLSDPLTIFEGESPGPTVARWMELEPPYDQHTRRQVVDFYRALPQALTIALQQAVCPAKPQKLKARGSLAMLLGYGGSDCGPDCGLPQLDTEATAIALALANDPQVRLPSLAPLIRGIKNPSYHFMATQSHLGFLQTLKFGWSWFAEDEHPQGDDGMTSDFEDIFFAEARDITLIEYLSCIPAISAELPQAANQEPGQQRLLGELEPALSYFLGKPRLEAGVYMRDQQTRGFWRPMASFSQIAQMALA